jgi:hypothetical protein
VAHARAVARTGLGAPHLAPVPVRLRQPHQLLRPVWDAGAAAGYPGAGAHAAALYASAPAHTDPRAVAHANAYAGSAAQAHAAADAYTHADWGPMLASTPAFGMVERSPTDSQHFI